MHLDCELLPFSLHGILKYRQDIEPSLSIMHFYLEIRRVVLRIRIKNAKYM